MNILEQEDFVKGVPDQALAEEAEFPTGTVPQFLVVSEIQRRQVERDKHTARRVPQNTITDQILAGGIAAMNPNPDPLMSMAMGAPPPMTGQDPMMQPPMQDPMMGQMQDPMMGQMPQDLAMMQDPMMQQQMMAAGGGMMPYRMNQGRTVPSLYSDLGAQEPGDIMRQLLQLGLSEAEVEEIIRQAGDPLSQQDRGLNLGNQPDYSLSALKQGQHGAIGKDAQRFGSKYPLGTQPDADLSKAVLADNTADKDLNNEEYAIPTNESIMQGIGGLNFNPEAVDYTSAIGRVNTARDTALAGLGKNKLDFISVYDENKPNLDFSSFAPPYAQLIADAEGRATAIKDEAKKDSGSQALIALGAGISEGNLGQGIRDAGTRMTDIRRQARKEASAESQLARRMEFAGEENKMNLGIKGQEASNVEVANRRGAIINQFKADRELQLAELKITDQAARDQLDLEVKGLEAVYSRGTDNFDANLEKFVQQGAMLRFKQLEDQSQRSLDRSILTAIARPAEDAFKEWSQNNPEATPEQMADFLRTILSKFITLPEIENYSANPENGTSSGRANGMSIVSPNL